MVKIAKKRENKMLELHCHTTYSDGSLSPRELVKKAVSAGVRILAISDHDTISGWEEALAAGTKYGVEIVPAIELSTVHRDCSLHILGYYPDGEKLRAVLGDRILARFSRARLMVEKLADLGYCIKLPILEEENPQTTPGRPHIAAALLEAGYVKYPQEAFDRWLGEGKPAYVPYDKFSIKDGIRLLRRCGAVPVWAHPCLFRGGKVEEVLMELLDAGLMGLEVFHPCHSAGEVERLKGLCGKYGLLMTGGSDYHGPVAGGKEMTSLNMLGLPGKLLSPIKEAAASLAPVSAVK
jgi:predicted metal-dependent phosphoesterase TrpH